MLYRPGLKLKSKDGKQTVTLKNALKRSGFGIRIPKIGVLVYTSTDELCPITGVTGYFSNCTAKQVGEWIKTDGGTGPNQEKSGCELHCVPGCTKGSFTYTNSVSGNDGLTTQAGWLMNDPNTKI